MLPRHLVKCMQFLRRPVSQQVVTVQQTRNKSDLYEPDYLIASIMTNMMRETRYDACTDYLRAEDDRERAGRMCPPCLLWSACVKCQMYLTVKSMEPDEPVYDCLNLQLKGYDFAVLEACQSQIHRYAEAMGLQVDECWATPAQQLKVQRFKPRSTVVDAEYQLNVYERNVQVSDVPAFALGTLLRVARAVLPEGCTLRVHEHSPEHEEVRYVPDNELLDLKQQLTDMGGPRPDKKRRK